ncbi:IAA-amino acid hydrolase, putative [Cryptosporidium muris RN66]|uniref:IAA-amino acid hydrolase, putative n=1 Tax=Cryptosporidium muris (strain RN66) TaxID=441375 RepID=B6AD20_CRYMR|nr:IAA-amino acid hydrolase, putative [Cryptosporidium muris RN66]EEA06024.1 IAA-amino acid hydrolase, putative [Cryptosporidium muris RN66]|eukprot:XP_002140373.1 IAA-amino acid hydrolase [Cryptosporidium muris RN66]
MRYIILYIALNLITLIVSSYTSSFNEILLEILKFKDEIVTNRRHLHSFPELAFQEFITSSYIQKCLKSLNIKFAVGFAGTGIVAEIGSGLPCVGLRADIDGLPIQESTDVSYKSQIVGQMHACGHDGHTAMLLGAAKYLKQNEHNIKGTVRLLFQPAEEGFGGAINMTADGALHCNVFKAGDINDSTGIVESIFGLHLNPFYPSGYILSKPGILLSACISFHIVIKGIGGHASLPAISRDPITAAIAMIQAINMISAKETQLPSLNKEVDVGVISITKINSGTACNVIPEIAEFGGTIRSYSWDTLNKFEERIKTITSSLAIAYRCEAEYSRTEPPFAPTINDEDLFNWANNINGIKIREVESTFGSEDFGYYSFNTKTLFLYLGQGDFNNTRFGLHNPMFNIDENVLPIGAALHSFFAMERLKYLHSNNYQSKNEEL